MRTPTSSPNPEPSLALIEAFLAASADAVRCLAAEPGFRLETSTKAFTATGVKTLTPVEVGQRFFHSVARFETDTLHGCIIYGDREFSVNLTLGRRGAAEQTVQWFGLWEWVTALGGADPRVGGGQFAMTAERVRTIVLGLGEVLSEYWPRIISAGPGTIAAMETVRELP